MFLFIYIITLTDIRKNQTANHGMNVFIRELLAIFLRKVFAEIHLAMNQRRRNILMHKHIVCCNRLAILCVDRHNIHPYTNLVQMRQGTIYNCPYYSTLPAMSSIYPSADLSSSGFTAYSIYKAGSVEYFFMIN